MGIELWFKEDIRNILIATTSRRPRPPGTSRTQPLKFTAAVTRPPSWQWGWRAVSHRISWRSGRAALDMSGCSAWTYDDLISAAA